jgi:hypothetical protein
MGTLSMTNNKLVGGVMMVGGIALLWVGYKKFAR